VAGVVISEEGGAFDDLELFDELLPELPTLSLITYVGPGERWFDDRGVPFDELIRRGGHGHREVTLPDPDPERQLALIYTSGTMGKPKGVLLSQRAMLTAARAGVARSGLAAADRLLLGVPLYQAFGLGALLTALEARATVVLLPRFEAALALRTMASHRVSHLPGTPTMFALLMQDPAFGDTDLTSLRGGVVGGMVVSSEAVDRIRAWCDVEIAYGLTETGPTVAMTARDDPAERRRATVGLPVDGVEVVVVDLQRGTHHGTDAVGELAVRGPTLMDGYHRMPRETAHSLTRDGYFLTGDLVHVDELGYISIIARRREVIIRAGQTVTPREIEDVLRTHPGVEDACVVGLPHPVLGELVAACVVTVEGATLTGPELRRFCQDMLAAAKVPDLVRFLDAFPVTTSGKVRRVELARTLAGGGA
jgi:fatty-acyl-CoA synthase